MLFVFIYVDQALLCLECTPKQEHTHTYSQSLQNISSFSLDHFQSLDMILIYYDVMHCCPLVKGHQKVSCGSSILKSRWYGGQISCCCCCYKEQFETIRNDRKWSFSQSELHSAMFRHVQQEILETVRIRKCIFAVCRLLRCKGRHWTQQQLSSNARHAEHVSSAMS